MSCFVLYHVLWYSQFFVLAWVRIPCCLSGIAHILVVHPDVVERNRVLQCLGYPFEGMERVYTKTITVLVIGLAVLIILLSCHSCWGKFKYLPEYKPNISAYMKSILEKSSGAGCGS